jgi:hypothetical protein
MNALDPPSSRGIIHLPAEPGGDDATIDPHGARSGVAPALTERVIPLRPSDLERLLLADPRLDPRRRAAYGRLFRLLGAVLHHDYLAQLLRLKELYAPLDPDNDCLALPGFTPGATTESDDAFLRAFEELVLKANYRPLDLEYLKQAVAEPNELGLNYVPNFELFDHLRVWVRGRTTVTRKARSLRTRFRKAVVVQPAYQRMVVALKFRPGKHLGDHARANVLYLRLFKDVPHVDMEMHLPEQGTRVKMRMIDKAQIASPVAVGLPGLAMKLMGIGSIFLLPTSVLLPLLIAPVSAGLNSFFGFQRAKQKHLHYMIRHLYYLTLANNASVITRLLDMAEEEEFKEAMLAYLLVAESSADHSPRADQLDRAVEALLRDRAGVALDFEIGDALDKLFRLGLVRRRPDETLEALPPEPALARLDRRWDTYCRPEGG